MKGVIQLLIQDSYSEVIGKIAGRFLLQAPMILKSASLLGR